MAVRIVTDSTADLPKEVAEELGITVVPLSVNFGVQVFKDGVDLNADQFYARLAAGGALPTTSQPSVGEFLEVYQRLAGEADGIVSVHVSSKVSGTFNSASRAAEQVGDACSIGVVDTLQASMGIGMVAIAASRAAGAGAGFQEVLAVAEGAVKRCQCFALLGTLEYLRKGGRIGRAQALLGTLLKINPVIIVSEGEVHPLDRPRTRVKGLARLRETAQGFAPLEELCVVYSTDLAEAERLAGEVAGLLPGGAEPFIARFGPALGTYVGPQAVGIGLLQSSKAAAPGV